MSCSSGSQIQRAETLRRVGTLVFFPWMGCCVPRVDKKGESSLVGRIIMRMS